MSHIASKALSYAALTAGEPSLFQRTLRTPEQRTSIAELRKLSASAVEEDLRLGLGHVDIVRDQIGMVFAYEREGRVVATLRFVPSGHGLTGLERLAGRVKLPLGIVAPGSWEVGRVVVAPEARHPDLLGQCFSLALVEIVRAQNARRFYAIATPLIARLWRRYGMQETAAIRGVSGKEYKIMQGRPVDVGAALHMPAGLLTSATGPTSVRTVKALPSCPAVPLG
ncbi:hypothetical protein [Hydrogenophaga crocea]|uniref:N-acetyltransferase domain-containing protein n=1 Tax=Hydrogenophaga crocea TaxID=2716225 RepID=A0A6G8ILH7_9BURK|nr:hypothetical protein [Hydrogenophaga crocea]QIM53969.1 hypothetical protein G9Q37_18290 [Hydrogenophaga crocea]